MKNSFFCITLVIFGFIVSIGIVLSIKALGNHLFPEWYWDIRILITSILLIIACSVILNKLICREIYRQLRNVKNQSPPNYRIEKYILRRWKYEDFKVDDFVDLTNGSGRKSRYSDERRWLAIEKWERIKRHPNGITLEEFLEDEFGITNGVLNVSRSSFYTWRRNLKKKANKKPIRQHF